MRTRWALYAYLILFMTAMLGVVLSNNLIQLWMFWGTDQRQLFSAHQFLVASFGRPSGHWMALAITGAGGLPYWQACC